MNGLNRQIKQENKEIDEKPYMESGSKTGKAAHNMKTVWDQIRADVTLSM